MSAKVFVLLCAATIPASFGLIQDGFFASSDGMIHLYRLFELDRSLQAGVLYPRWFPLSGYGYGLPVLNYYSPLAYYLAEIFHLLGAGYIVSIKLLIASGFILAALAMFLIARDLLGAAPAFVASLAFVYLPYLLSDAFVRGNFPEFLAMSLIPLALYAFRKLDATRNLKFFILAATAFAAIILSHHLTAMLAAPLVVVYILLLFALNRVWKNLFICASAMVAALAVSAFYWVPAITELNLVFVDSASIPRFLVSRLVSAADFFAPSLAYSYLPQSDALLHSAGFPQTVAAIFGGAVIVTLSVAKGIAYASSKMSRFAQHYDNKSLIYHSLFFFLVLLLSILMMLNVSAPLWYAIPTLRFMQFPWRVEVLAGISIAFLIGVLAMQIEQITNYRLRLLSYSLASLALVVLAIVNLPMRAFQLDDAQLYLWHSDDPDYVVAQMGWSWTREFVPASVQEATVIGQKVRQPSTDSPRAIPSVQVENEGLLSRTVRVSAQESFVLSLHTFFYPGWQAYVDNVPIRAYADGALGLVAATVPRGDHTVAFRFEETPFRSMMDFVSVLVVLIGILWMVIAYRRAFVALAIALIFFAALFLIYTRATPAQAVPIARDVNFENQALLIGYSTERADDKLYVTLYWLALAEMDRDHVSFVHLVGSNDETIAQDDSITDQGVTPTTRWQIGELVTDHHTLVLKNAPRGEYRLIAGLYLPRENGLINLTVRDRTGNSLGNQVELGRIQLAQ